MSTATVMVALISLMIGQLTVFGWLLRGQLQRNAALSRLARTDDLTGLANRRGLHHAHRAFAADGTPAAVLLLDLTGFKRVNDRHGHNIGDSLLRQIARRLTALAAQHAGVAGRLGGDEFVLLLPHHTGAQLTANAAHLLEAVAEPVDVPGIGPITVTGVLGLAAPGDSTLAEPFRAADIALYHARHHGTGWALYNHAMAAPAASSRHGQRLRNLRDQPNLVHVDQDRLQEITATVTGADQHTILDDLHGTIALLDPRTRTFGTDVADFVHDSLDHGLLTHRLPVTGLTIAPTTVGELRDGGFLVLAEVSDTIILASARIGPEEFADTSNVAATVLDAVARTVNQLHAAYRTLAEAGLR
jgi:diguanylate cyclase (GGDEF)-like protein